MSENLGDDGTDMKETSKIREQVSGQTMDEMGMREGSVLTEAETKPTTYRLFWTNGAGRIASVADTVDAQDDAEAIREAERLARGRTVEVWDRSRKVAMLNGAERR